MTYVGEALSADNLDALYDVIVIGSGMGGLSASSVLAQKGKKVLLLEQHSTIGGCTHVYKRKGFEWNIGLHYIGEVQQETSMTRKLFDYVTGSGIQWDPMPEVYNRIFVADREYRFRQGRENYGQDLKHYFPREHEAIDRYLDLMKQVNRTGNGFFAAKALTGDAHDALYDDLSAPFLAFSEKTTYEVLSGLTDNEELIAVICGNYGDYSLPPKKSAFAMHCMLIRHYMDNASYPAGGAAALARAIVPIIERAGGAVRYHAGVEQVLVENGTACGVRFANGQEVRAGAVISNAGVNNTFGKLLPDDVPQREGLAEKLESVEHAYCAVGLNIGLNADAQTLGLHGANIWAHPGPDLDGNNARHSEDFSAPFPWCFITFPSAKDSTWSDRFPDKSTIEMFASTDFDHFSAWSGTDWRRRGADYDALKEQIAARMFAELYKYVPQIRDHIEYFEVSTPVSYQKFLARDRGNFMGVEASPARFRQKWLRAETPIEGLYLTGQDIVTDGIIGALMSGVITSSCVLQENIAGEIAAQ